MPYKTKSDLPESVKHVLPSHAGISIKKRSTAHGINIKIKIGVMTPVAKTAHKVAQAAVKHEYAKGMMINGIKIVKPVA